MTSSGAWTPKLVTTLDPVTEESSFLASGKFTAKRGGVTLDKNLVAADADGNKVVKRGTFVSAVTATGKYGPYAGLTNEVQTLTEGGAGLTSYTISFGGVTTASIDDDATAAQVQAALEALPNLDVGDVEVTGTTNPIALTVTFRGEWAGKDVPAMTTTPTGGTGTVVVATSTAGGAALTDGRQLPGGGGADSYAGAGNLISGFTLESVNLKDGDVVCGLLIEGSVLSARISPPGFPTGNMLAATLGRIIYQ